MAIIQNISGTQLEVDATPKAARVILYNADGSLDQPTRAGYIARLDVVPTTLGAATSYFSIRNLSGGALKCYLTKIEIKLGFSGLAAATTSRYEFIRFSGATPSGGTSIGAVKKDNSAVASAVDVRFAAGGLTTTGITFEANPWHLIGHTNQLNVDHGQDIEFDKNVGFALANGEGMMIRANGAIVLGSYLIGSLRWEER